MRPCSQCRRHVRLSEGCCPFCGGKLVEGTAPAAVGWAVGLAMLGAACGPGKAQESAGEGTGEASTSGEASTGTTNASTSSTTSATTAEPTTAEVNSSGCGSAGCTDSTEGGGFIYGTPDGGVPVECDPWVQDCPKGQKCMPMSLDGDNSWEALKCRPVAPDPDQTGEPCTDEGTPVDGIDSCDVGNVCWNVDPMTKQGVCVQQCQGSPVDPQCPDDTGCLISGDGILTLCLNNCDPVLQDCSGGKVCIPDPQDFNSFICAADESGAGGQVFDACDVPNGCDAGLACVQPTLAEECDAMAAGCCLPFCDLTMPECPGANQCVPWFEQGQAPPGLENVGLCGVPQ